MAKRRRFTPEFKAELVFEVLSGGSSQTEVWGPPTQPQRKSTLRVEATPP